MVYSEHPDGHVVDKKAYNFKMSNRPQAATMTVAGSLCFTLATVGDIPAGAIVQEGTAVSGDQRLDVSAGGANETLLGVANHTRQLNDNRPLTYTILGVVEIMAGETVAVGDFLQPCDTTNTLGSAEPWINDVDGTNAEGLTAQKRKIGKALTGATQGNPFWAFVNFMG